MKRIYVLPAALLVSGALGAALLLNVFGSDLRNDPRNAFAPAMLASHVQSPSLNTLLNDSPGPVLRLYGSAESENGQAPERAFEIGEGEPGKEVSSFVQNRDHSTADSTLKPDSRDVRYAQTYYPEPLSPPQAAPPTSTVLEARHPHIKQTFAADTDTLIDEEVRRYNGMMAQELHVKDDRFQETKSYALDARLILWRLVDLHPEESWMKEKLLEEKHWRSEGDRRLSYTNILNENGTRTITDWDAYGRALRVAVWQKWGNISGTTVTGYFEDGSGGEVPLKTRFESTSTGDSDNVSYYRQDRSLSYTVYITSYARIINYFDESGKRRVLQQWWSCKDTLVNGIRKPFCKLDDVTEYGARGEVFRKWSFLHAEGKLDRKEEYGITVGDTTYKEIDSVFDSDENLVKVMYWKDEIKSPPDKEEDHEASEHIRATVPAELTILRAEIDDWLPIPEPRRGPGG